MEEQIKELKIEEIKKKVNELLKIDEVEELVKSNEKILEIDGLTYRIRKPTFKQKQETYQKRVEKFTELLSNDKYKMEADLKTIYLKRNIDVDKMTAQVQSLMLKRDDFLFKLGDAIKNNAPDSDLQSLKKEIETLNLDIQSVVIEKTRLLEFSIEQQVLIYTYSYLTYLLAEKKESENNWVRVWNTWEEFENDKSNLSNKFSYFTTMMNSLEEM